MGRVLTDNTGFSVARESSIATLPGTPVWFTVQPNDITNFGAEITTTPRNPISKDRQRRKGTTTDLDSAVEFNADLIMEHVNQFIEGYTFSSFNGPVALYSGSARDTLAADDALTVSGTPPGFSHDAISGALAAGTLLWARGFSNSANNGLHVVTANSSTTETATSGSTSIVAETPSLAANASIEVCGVRLDDATWTDASNTLGSSNTNLTTLGLTVGQFICIGGLTTTTRFEDTLVAYGRITSIAADTITLDKVTNDANFGAGDLDGGGDQAAQDVDILFGRFSRNVDVDDGDYLEQSFQFEAAWENLQQPSGTGDEYEYAKGNFCNTLGFVFNGQDKATMNFGFIGTDTPAPTTSRATGASTPVGVVQSEAFNTSSDFLLLAITDTSGTDISTYFKDLTVTLNNNVSPEKVLNTLGAAFMNNGTFEVSFSGEALFDDSDALDAIRNNTTLTSHFGVKNADGGIFIDIPYHTMGDGSRNLPRNESVTVSLSGDAFGDSSQVITTSVGVSLFPVLPTAA